MYVFSFILWKEPFIRQVVGSREQYSIKSFLNFILEDSDREAKSCPEFFFSKAGRKNTNLMCFRLSYGKKLLPGK